MVVLARVHADISYSVLMEVPSYLLFMGGLSFSLIDISSCLSV